MNGSFAVLSRLPLLDFPYDTTVVMVVEKWNYMGEMQDNFNLG